MSAHSLKKPSKVGKLAQMVDMYETERQSQLKQQDNHNTPSCNNRYRLEEVGDCRKFGKAVKLNTQIKRKEMTPISILKQGIFITPDAKRIDQVEDEYLGEPYQPQPLQERSQPPSNIPTIKRAPHKKQNIKKSNLPTIDQYRSGITKLFQSSELIESLRTGKVIPPELLCEFQSLKGQAIDGIMSKVSCNAPMKQSEIWGMKRHIEAQMNRFVSSILKKMQTNREEGNQQPKGGSVVQKKHSKKLVGLDQAIKKCQRALEVAKRDQKTLALDDDFCVNFKLDQEKPTASNPQDTFGLNIGDLEWVRPEEQSQHFGIHTESWLFSNKELGL